MRGAAVGFAVAARVVRTVLVVVVVVSVVTGVDSGAVAGSAVVAGGGSLGTGCASWASKGVEESARAAAIAGRALARA
jgi:hypothetical protein